MNKYKDYYRTLNIDKNSTSVEIKKSYYKLSFKYHPDHNKGIKVDMFNEINEAYTILSDEIKRSEYDKMSKWGRHYDETLEMFNMSSLDYDVNHMETFKKNYVNNIRIEVDESFDGNIEYERYVMCRGCDGTGKDIDALIYIRDSDGNITKVLDGDSGCDFCEGKGEYLNGDLCAYCQGVGRIGSTPCGKCLGEKRFLGRQKLKNIKLTGNETKIEGMGHYSKDGKVGYLLIIKGTKGD